MIIPDAEFIQWQKDHPKAWLILAMIIEAGGVAQFTYRDTGMGKRQFFECLQDLKPLIQVYREGRGNVYAIGNQLGNQSILDNQREEGDFDTEKGNQLGNQSSLKGNRLGNQSIPDKQREEPDFDTEKGNQLGNQCLSSLSPSAPFSPSSSVSPTPPLTPTPPISPSPSDPPEPPLRANDTETDTEAVTESSRTVAGTTPAHGQLQLKGSAAVGESKVIVLSEQKEMQQMQGSLFGEDEPVVEKKKQKKLSKDALKKKYAKEFNEEFWPGVSYKVAPRKAEAAYVKLRMDIKRKCTLSVKEIQKRYNQCVAKCNGEYVPYPSTWLNQDRWADEPAPQQLEQEQAKQEQKERVSEMTSRWVQNV